jgi:hypothetical protein
VLTQLLFPTSPPCKFIHAFFFFFVVKKWKWKWNLFERITH